MNSVTLSQLIEHLKNPEFYPHAVETPIQVVQTHISVVFLTGEYAYKLKKPVNFGFLDFSTLDKRDYFLNQELTMNKPVASDIYLEVLPITRDGENLKLGGTGDPIEYVLKMRQFPQNCLFSSLFEEGKLTENLIKNLGKLVADFHSQTRTDEYIKQFGEVEKIKEAFDENYQQTEKYIEIAQTQKQFEETKTYTDKFFQDNQDLFKQRREQDKIRECHGDLHLKNICLWNDKIYLFDRIEFNEPFRFVDVMYDIGFAVMDLDAKGRKDLGNIFLNTYIEQTGDWEGLQVLPLYQSRQAYVRAKVTSFLLDDPSVDESTKQEAIKSASDYYRLAWGYTQHKSGKLILMCGLSGSGKTTVAQKLATEINAIHIRSDAVRKHLAGISLSQRGTEAIYTAEMSQKTYDRLLELGTMLVKIGYPVILDAKYDRREWRSAAIAFAESHQIPLEILHCSAPLEMLSDRLKARTTDISDATPNLLASQQANFEPFSETELPYVKTIDTTTV
ncbi:AAA family ATPase [Gloeothece citriformis]|nr:AAA family ATPase [Gloeothece citriformis]